MAHLPDDDLPSTFDVVVVGTGLTQSILAAAASRVGKAVLHLDYNSYYGGCWATLMYNDLQRWIELHSKQDHDEELGDITSQLNEDEVSVKCNVSMLGKVTNVVEINHTGEYKENEEEEKVEEEKVEEGKVDEGKVEEEKVEEGKVDEGKVEEGEVEEGEGDEVTKETSVNDSPINDEPVPSNETPDKPIEEKVTSLTWDNLGNNKRRFNFDLVPKLMYCRGGMVDAIVQSGVSRYIEFRSLPKLYCSNSNNEIIQVPCSRADVFTSTIVSMLEKRKLMKVLTFCAEYEKHQSEYQDYIERPFAEFLRSRDLTDNLVQFILHSIAMADESETTLNGLKATQVFLHSLGRFGNAPFLYPLFGNGELPQGFCRLSAVFGGVYCLKRSVRELIVSSDRKQLLGVTCTTGQRIKCSTFIGPAGTFDSQNVTRQNVSRAIFVTDGQITGIDEKISLLTIPPGPDHTTTSRVSLLQFDSTALTTPEGTNIIHATCKSSGSSARNDLEFITERFFSTSSSDDKPRLLWSLYYNIALSSCPATTDLDLPSNVVMVSDPDSTIAYESCIEEAKRIFESLFPDEPFLPRMPNTEDIIYGEEETSSNDQLIEGGAEENSSDEDADQETKEETCTEAQSARTDTNNADNNKADNNDEH